MDLWHTEISNVSMRIWEEMKCRCTVGTWKAKSTLNKDEGTRSNNVTEWSNGFVCWMFIRTIHMHCCEKMRCIRAVMGRLFLQGERTDWSCWHVGEWASIMQQLWAVLEHVKSWKGQLWVVVSSSQPHYPLSKMCHLNNLAGVGSILPGVARGLGKACTIHLCLVFG